MRFRNPVFGVVSFAVAALLLHSFKETTWAIFVERLLEEAAHYAHIEKAEMAAFLSQLVIIGGGIWLLLHIAYRMGQKDKPVKEDPLVSAHRDHTAALRDQTEAINKPATQTVRNAFSQTQTINNFPPFLRGNQVLRLDSVATLRLAPPYSMQSITLALDAVPIDLKASHDPAKVQVAGAQIYFGAQNFVFDIHQNKRKEIEASGRTFIVTLHQVKLNETINMANAIEWIFGVSEK